MCPFHFNVEGRGLGVISGKIRVAFRGNFITSSECSGDGFWPIRSYIYSLAVSEMHGLVAPNLPHGYLPPGYPFPVPVRFLFPVGIRIPKQCLFHGLPVRVT